MVVKTLVRQEWVKPDNYWLFGADQYFLGAVAVYSNLGWLLLANVYDTEGKISYELVKAPEVQRGEFKLKD